MHDRLVFAGYEFKEFIHTPKEPADWAIGLSIGALVSSAAIYYTYQEAWEYHSQALAHAQPLNSRLDIVNSQRTFVSTVYSAINDPNSASYIDSIPYDNKTHSPLHDIVSEQANRELNANFSAYRASSGPIGETVRRVQAATSAPEANKVLLDTSNSLDQEGNALEHKVAALESHDGHIPKLVVVSEGVFGLVFGAVILASATARLKDAWSSRRSVKTANKVFEKRVKYEAKGITDEVEDFLRLQAEQGSEGTTE